MAFKMKKPSPINLLSKDKRIARVSSKLTKAEKATNADPSKRNERKEDRLQRRYDRLTEGSVRRQNRLAKKNNK